VIVTGERGNTISNFFKQFQMDDLILKQHGRNAPNTFINGSTLIDGIFGTEGINAIYSGYTSFTWGMYSDHCLLWVDLDKAFILGSKAGTESKTLAMQNPNNRQTV
jgi:hypothetical protein